MFPELQWLSLAWRHLLGSKENIESVMLNILCSDWQPPWLAPSKKPVEVECSCFSPGGSATTEDPPQNTNTRSPAKVLQPLHLPVRHLLQPGRRKVEELPRQRHQREDGECVSLFIPPTRWNQKARKERARRRQTWFLKKRKPCSL